MPLVSVHMITYNHEKYIAQAIEGVLMQKCDFPIQLVIGEDCSTDNTAAIIKEYEKKYPDIIKARYNNPNKGMHANGILTFQECTGKYIATCEGDDYWTDPLKLQKQVDFLVQHPECSFCFHDSEQLKDGVFHKSNSNNSSGIVSYSVDEFFNISIQSATVLLRNNDIINNLLNINAPHGDIVLWTLMLQYGYCAKININGAVRRVHDNGIFSGATESKKYLSIIKTRRAMLQYDGFSNKTKFQISKQLTRKKKKGLLKLIKKCDFIGFIKLLFA